MSDLRPKFLVDFAGQPSVNKDLSIIIKASLKRGDLPDHMLFSGPPGLGKTTLANIIANELNIPFVQTSAPSIEKPSELASILTSISSPSLLFIDEIHALDRKTEEVLYSAMEDGFIDIIVGEGQKSRSIKIELEKFILVGATTLSGNLSSPLIDRFGYHGRLDLYSEDELAKIIKRSSSLLSLAIEEKAIDLISSCSRGTPRIANKLLRRVRDIVDVLHEGKTISFEIATSSLSQLGIDKLGLDQISRNLLLSLAKNFNGGPVGISTLATTINESPASVEFTIEPYLLRAGLLQRTQRGRIITEKGYKHLTNIDALNLESDFNKIMYKATNSQIELF